ncbi:MAG: ornithine cyclodeaminase family protein [Betaproteobacteria bacterium]|nr:MAG: ornithine cyclodeaminase family protein [Betaproteobacteria bacterium]
MPFFSAAEVHAALDYRTLAAALREAFREGCVAPLRHVHDVTGEGDRLLLMPAWHPGRDLGVKLVTVFPRNRARGAATVSALYVLLDGVTGHPRALIDGEALTLRRTAAASALASTYLARKDSATLLVIGTGALAPHMARAHCALRPITSLLLWGRSLERAQALAALMRDEGLPAQALADLQSGLGQADMVSCATTATEPVLRGTLIRPGTHVDLVGGFTPQMREADDTLIARAEIFVDTYAGALKEAGDLVQPLASGMLARERVRAELAELVAGAHPGRKSATEITLFKSVGTALEDLCAAQMVVEGG